MQWRTNVIIRWSGLRSAMGPGCVKTPKSNFRGECLSRIPSIRKELHWPVPPNEETREHNSVRSPRVHVFTQPGSTADSCARWQPIGQAYILPSASYCSDDRWTI